MIKVLVRSLVFVGLVFAYCAVEVANADLVSTSVACGCLGIVVGIELPKTACVLGGVFGVLTIQAADLAEAGLENHLNRAAWLRWLVFAALAAVFSGRRLDGADDCLVTFKPCEERIRRLLRHQDPAQLHRVDGWLATYKGRERELLRLLEDRYVDEVPRRGATNGGGGIRRAPGLWAVAQATEGISALRLS